MEGNQGSPEELAKAEEMLEGQPYQRSLSKEREKKAQYLERIGAKGFVERMDNQEPTAEEIKEHAKDLGADFLVNILQGTINGRQFTIRKVHDIHNARGGYSGSIAGISEALTDQEAADIYDRYRPAAIILSGYVDKSEEESAKMEGAAEERREVAAEMEKKKAESKESVLRDLLGGGE